MLAKLLFPIVTMGVFLAYTLYTLYRRKKGMPDASRMFFERTGYRYADILNQPLEAHVHYGKKLMKGARNGYRIHMVRDFHGMPIHNVMDYTVSTALTGSKTQMSYAWSVPLSQPLRVPIQIADKSLRGFRKGLGEVFSNSERVWDQQFEHPVQSGDPQFDDRFNVYSSNPPAAHALLQNHSYRQMLMHCAEVDLTVYPDQIRFSDPGQKNLASNMGGTLGAMSMATNPAKAMELSIPIHDHIAQVLATTYQACA